MEVSAPPKLVSVKVARSGAVSMVFRTRDKPRQYLTVSCDFETVDWHVIKTYLDIPIERRPIKSSHDEVHGAVVFAVRKASISNKAK